MLCFSLGSCDPLRRDEEDRASASAWSNKEEAKQAFKELLKDKVINNWGKEKENRN